MHQAAQAAVVEPPSSPAGASLAPAFFPGRAFGHGSGPYWAFVGALAEGLAEYEAVVGGGAGTKGGMRGNVAAPVPAA